MDEMAATDTKVVPDGILCIGCGYELSGLPFAHGSKCPECGLEIEKTRVGPLLRYEPREWLQRTAGGLRLLHHAVRGFAAIGASLLVFLVFGILGVMLYQIAGSDSSVSAIVDVLAEIFIVIIRVAFVIALGTMIVGIYRLSRPPEILRPEGGNWRLWMLVGPFCLIGLVVIGAIEKRGGATVGWVRWSMSLSLVLTTMCAWVSLIAMDRVLHELDARCSGVPELDPLPRMTGRWIGWRIFVCLFVGHLAFTRFSTASGLVLLAVLIGHIDFWRRVRVTRERVAKELGHKPEHDVTIQPS